MAPQIIPSVVLAKRQIKQPLNKNKKQVNKNYRGFITPESLVKKNRQRAFYRQRYKSKIRVKNSKFSDKKKLALLIRTKSPRVLTQNYRTILKNFNLTQKFSAVFVCLTQKQRKDLSVVDDLIVYGIPDLQTVQELILRRGRYDDNGQGKVLSNNAVIEQRLGSKGLICMEDLIHEIYTMGKNFETARNFLMPFQLTDPTSQLKNKMFNDDEVGKTGFRKDINELVKKMI
mmetsp:Transcript_17238/g.25547  ORF Transcript_17238/g.25547 Transcript_17238/m.25547 type:complete len:230 (+) Transcript_17238:35-724(+)